MTADGADGVSTGELSRGLGRVEREMHAGFSAIRSEIRALAFVPLGVYASDMTAQRERLERVEKDLGDERTQRREDQQVADQRSWQVRLALIAAAISLVTALVTAALK